MVSRITGFLILVCFALIFGPVAVSHCAEKSFEVKADGGVQFNGKQYQSVSEYFRSAEFHANGMRCGTKPLAEALATARQLATAFTEDCTTMETVLNGDYWPDNVYVIPIVFHIIRKTDGTGDIPDSRIFQQVKTLNEDYRAMTGSLGEPGFDSHVQFELAGITRAVNDDWFNDVRRPDYIAEDEYKAALGWNQKRYLNVYVNSARGYLGYAYLPQTSAGMPEDGVVLYYDACGGRDQGSAPYDQGRTLTHEVGHYLGLFHTFEGGCETGLTAGDLIEDTNPEKEEHYGCTETHSCSLDDPIHNYMDYTDDLCMWEFTREQSNRAMCGLMSYRPVLHHIDGGATEKKIYVHKVVVKLDDSTGGKSAIGRVVVRDQSGNPVPGVLVSVRWSGLVEATDFKNTNSRGVINFSSPETEAKGTFTFEVTNIYLADKKYAPLRNVATTGSISN